MRTQPAIGGSPRAQRAPPVSVVLRAGARPLEGGAPICLSAAGARAIAPAIAFTRGA